MTPEEWRELEGLVAPPGVWGACRLSGARTNVVLSDGRWIWPEEALHLVRSGAIVVDPAAPRRIAAITAATKRLARRHGGPS